MLARLYPQLWGIEGPSWGTPFPSLQAGWGAAWGASGGWAARLCVCVCVYSPPLLPAGMPGGPPLRSVRLGREAYVLRV